MFSRVASRLHAETNPLYRLRDQLREQGTPVLDLISGNVNELGIIYPQEILQEALLRATQRTAVYRPDSFGQRAARDTISGYYRDRRIALPPESILLTPGTSIAYWYCFKLLMDEGDEVLCPRPSYPLFDYIGALSGVRLIPYPLDEANGWEVDLHRLEASISTRTRALVLISPHNPTGHVSSSVEIEAVADIVRRHGLAIISDEVFSEFLLDGKTLPRPAEYNVPLVLTLNGLSKMFALPGMKLGWMAVSGDRHRVREALRALELISDTFLPVNEVVQAAVPDLFRGAGGFLSSYQRDIRVRWNCTHDLLVGSRELSFVAPQGGFYLTLRLEQHDEEQAAKAVLQDGGLLVHPGFFYDMAPQHLVLSFVHPPEVLRDTLPRLLEILASCRRSR